MSLTQTFRDGIVTDLTNYTGYVTLPTIYKEAKDVDSIRKPALMVAPGGGGESESLTLEGLLSTAVQQFGILAVVSAREPVEALDDLTDEVRNAIERTGSTIVNLSDVIRADVTSWDDLIPDEDDPEPTILLRQIIVAVAYTYTRGSL